MGQYRFLALDIDGTLANSKKEITAPVKEEIRRLQEAGIPVALVSGRPVPGIRHVADELDFDKYHCYILAFNGGKIIDSRTNQVIYNETVPMDLAQEVCRVAKNYNVSLVTYKDEEIVCNRPDNPYTQIESRITHMSVRGVEDMGAELTYEPDKFLFTGDPEYLESILEEMQQHFQGRLNVFRSEPFFMEFVPLGIDKAKSLDRLLSSMGLSASQLVACGDGYNDVSMVDYAGMGVAMENACAETKAVANYIAPSCDEDGVAVAIKKFF